MVIATIRAKLIANLFKKLIAPATSVTTPLLSFVGLIYTRLGVKTRTDLQ